MKAFRFKVKFGHVGFVCFVLYKVTISGEHLQDHWSSGLAHLSQRLIGELIGYSWSGIRLSVVRPSVVVVNNFKRLLLQNRLANQSQILCGASLGRGNKSLFAASGSYDQDGRHTHIW